MSKEIAIVAAKRIMEILGVDAYTIGRFVDDGEVLMSVEGAAPVELGEREGKLVQELEQRGDCLVYHVVAGKHALLGECVSLLGLPTKYPSEFPLYEEQARSGNVYAYVENIYFPENTEAGFIVVEKRQGLYRTY